VQTRQSRLDSRPPATSNWLRFENNPAQNRSEAYQVFEDALLIGVYRRSSVALCLFPITTATHNPAQGDRQVSPQTRPDWLRIAKTPATPPKPPFIALTPNGKKISMYQTS
jgi:hypothetical protein